MKRVLFCLTCATLLVAGCTTDVIDTGGVETLGTPQIRIDGSIDQNYTTRVDDGGFCDGDQIGLYGVNYTADNTVAGGLVSEGNQVDNARYTFDEGQQQWNTSGSIYYKDVNTNIDLYAYYPYASVDSVEAYQFEVAQDQSGNTPTDGYSQSDFLWGKTENVVPSQDKVKIRFNHILACANVVLTEGNGFAEGEFAAFEKSVLVMNTSRTAEINLATGIATPTGKAAGEGIVMKSNTEGFRAIVVPQSIEAGVALFSITIDGISYRFKSSDAFTYEAGKQSKFTIKINKKEHSGTYEFVLTDTEIIDWIADLDPHGGEALQYYVVHLDEPGTLEEKIAEAKKDPAKIKNLKVSGKLGTTDISFIRQNMTIVQSINLKESRIIAQKWFWRGYINEQYANLYFYTDYPSSTEKAEAEVQALYPNASLQTSVYARTQEYEDDVIPVDAFSYKSTLINFVFPEKITKINRYAFQGCSLLSGALIIPDDVVMIDEAAFAGCSNITSLSLPPSLKRIDGRAFEGCSALSDNLELPSSLERIDYRAFEGCSGFTGQLVLPDNLTYLGSSVFKGCSGFTGDLVIPTSLTNIMYEAFEDCEGLNGRLVLHDGITEIGNRAFFNCSFQGELKLPVNLLKIPYGCFAHCQFSSIAGFPKGLVEIGNDAFYQNNRLMGTLELPNKLVSLGEGAFGYCKCLECVVLPAELTILKEGLFQANQGIKKIICKATVPPIVQDYVFGGLNRKNIIVEVPEESVTKYQADVKWREFTRISAHHDFNLSGSKMRVLNAEHSRNFILYAPAGFEWSVESCPEWVTVTPSSGVGKAEVTITVNQMTEADIKSTICVQPKMLNGRNGEVVFLLNDKDYRATMNVEQYDYQYGDGDVLTAQTATAVDPKNGINLVFMGDCFDAYDIALESYINGTSQAIEHFFAVEPYKTYRDYFNVYTIFGMSNDSGVGTADTIRDAKFGSQYYLSGITPNTQITYEYALKAETVNMENFNKTLIVMVENTTEYGGTTALWTDGSAIAMCPMSDDAYPYDFRGIVQHEACGHGFAKLADENICYCNFIDDEYLKKFQNAKSLGWYRNLEITGDMSKVGWNHLIFNPTYSNFVDIYEGGFYFSRGVYRSESVSCMNNNIPYFSTISRQEAVERIMRYSGKSFNIDDFYANDVLDLQGSKASQSAAAPTAISLTGTGKQMPPKMMGHSPFDK